MSPPQKGKRVALLLQVLEKHRATLEFEVNEDDVEGRWLRNGLEIQFSVEERFNYVAIRKLHRLTISETYRSDAGEYTFIAGKNRSTVHLRVNSESSRTRVRRSVSAEPVEAPQEAALFSLGDTVVRTHRAD